MKEKTKMASTIVDTVVFDCIRSYQSAAENAGLLTDVLTVGSINTASDTIAQLLSINTEQNLENNQNKDNSQQSKNNLSLLEDPIKPSYDTARTLRLSLFGLADGAVSHIWFLALDSVVGEGQGLFDTLLKTAADAFVYTPLWCAWFLAFMTIIEPNPESIFINSDDSISNRFQSVFNVWSSDWFELFQGNLGFFLPLTSLIYGFVPREGRVLAFSVASLVYTIILSLWNESRGKDDTFVPVVDMELCAVDDIEQNCAPVPRPSRAILPFRLRRVAVKARRYFL